MYCSADGRMLRCTACLRIGAIRLKSFLDTLYYTVSGYVMTVPSPYHCHEQCRDFRQLKERGFLFLWLPGALRHYLSYSAVICFSMRPTTLEPSVTSLVVLLSRASMDRWMDRWVGGWVTCWVERRVEDAIAWRLSFRSFSACRKLNV